MKISEITIEDVASYLRLETEEYLYSEIEAMMTAAKNVISSYTGLPLMSDDPLIETVDSHEDFYIAFMVLIQDMYENRTLVIEKGDMNRTVEMILGLHDNNLVG